MEKLLAVIEVLKGEKGVVILAALLAVSEALALIPWVKSNSILQAIFNGIKRLAGRGTVSIEPPK